MVREKNGIIRAREEEGMTKKRNGWEGEWVERDTEERGGGGKEIQRKIGCKGGRRKEWWIAKRGREEGRDKRRTQGEGELK